MTQPGSTATTMASLNRGSPAWRSPISRIWQIVLLLLVVLGSLSLASPSNAQDNGQPPVYVVPIQGTIEPGIQAFLERSLEEAADAGAVAVILDIETPGGRLDTVLAMRDALLGTPIPVIAYVNREAFSAGALITIASDEIWMAPGAVYGAATPVVGGTGETADEKTISAVRSTFRATAEQQGRDPLIAEAMVDPAVVVEGLDSSTTLLTLTTDQALQWGYAVGVASDLDDLLSQVGLGSAPVVEMDLSPIERLVRVITDPIVSSLLITAGLFLIIADAFFAGFGVAAVAGVACLGLFFWGHTLAGLAGWEDLVLIGIGLFLLALEVFVIPGFGIAGIAGLISLVAGLVLTMSGRDFSNFEVTGEVIRAGWVVVISLGLALLLLIGVSLLMPKAASRRLGGIGLSATVDDDGQGMLARPPRSPGWLVRRFGGAGVLESGDVHMPGVPPGEQPNNHR
jgi:membrane-bound serine protease (ClpP class)